MILVTGATGTNGKELIRQLTAAGQRVRAFVRDAAKAESLKGEQVELAEGNFDQVESLHSALQGVEKAFLLVPVAEQFPGWQTAFIEIAKHAGVRHLVKFSGMGAAAGQTAGELLRLHGETDEFLRRSGLPFTILQPNSFHQNILGSLSTINGHGVFYWPMKDAAQSTVDVRDINAVATKVLTTPGHEGQTYVITGPAAPTFDQAADVLSRVLNRTIRYVPVSSDAAADSMRKAGLPEWNIRAVCGLLDYCASGAASRVTDTVSRLLGRPAISFEQFVQDHQSFFTPSVPSP